MIGTYAAYFVKQAGAYLRYTQNCTSGLTVAGRLCCSQRALAPATMLDSSRNVSVASAEAFSPQALQVGSIERRPRSQQRVAACLRTSRRRGSSSRAHFCAPPKNDWATRGTGGRAEIQFPLTHLATPLAIQLSSAVLFYCDGCTTCVRGGRPLV